MQWGSQAGDWEPETTRLIIEFFDSSGSREAGQAAGQFFLLETGPIFR